MNILAFDTATEACTIALQAGNVVFSRFDIVPRLHAQKLLPTIQSLLDEAAITLSALNAIAFGCGPGSFMGVRLAAGMAQGLAFGLQIPVIPISTLQIIAQAAYEKKQEKKIIAGWDARMHEIYWGFYACDAEGIMQPQQPDALCAPDKLDRNSWSALGCAFAGNVFSENTYPEANAMLKIALSKYARGEMVAPEHAHPNYVRHRVVHLN